MRKKIVFGSVIIIALMMLVSIQVAFFQSVKSNIRNENLQIGNIWNSMLDVSSHIREFRYISIAHVNKTDTSIIVPHSNGNITVRWSVNINSNNHPELYAAFSLFVYNIDDDNKEIGNATLERTYNRNSIYSQFGYLKVPFDFSSFSSQNISSVTLICEIGASFTLNKTREAKNFSSIANDQGVAVIFLNGIQPPRYDISSYIEKANKAFPSMWSWIDGWNSKFNSENEMLNEQTFFQAGWNLTSVYDDGNVPWWFGNITVNIWEWNNIEWNWEADTKDINWTFNSSTYPGYAEGQGRVNFTINLHKPPPYQPVTMRWILFYDEGTNNSCMKWSWPAVRTWIHCYDFYPHYIKGDLQISDLHDVNPHDGAVKCQLHVWAGLWFGIIPKLNIWEYNYYCHNVSDAENSPGSGGTSQFYWEEECAYSNSTACQVSNYTIGGITYVNVNISPFLAENQLIYTWRGDTGDTKVTITC